jgi:cytochrome c biogenesis protein CcmG/thiol:disulfide interchange protein DsbE
VSGNRPRKLSTTAIVLGVLAVIVVIAGLVAVTSSSDGDDSSSSSKSTSHETGPVTVEGAPLPEFPGSGQVDPAIGDTAPTLVGESFDGSPVTIKPTGKPQVVVFLAHWCPHCQAEVPRIVAVAKSGGLDGIDVSAVATSTSAEAGNYPPSAWLAREKWPFPVLADSKTGTAGVAYGLPSFPYFVFLDGAGQVLGRSTGEAEPAALKAIFNAMRDGDPLPLPGSGASSAS